MRKLLLILFAFVLVGCAGRQPAQAQFIGFTAPQTTSENIFTNQAVAGASAVIANRGQSVHYVRYTTTGTVTTLSIQLEGRNATTESFIRISETATDTAEGAFFATVYMNQVRVNLTTLTGGGTVTATYTGTSVAAGPPAGLFTTSGINNKTLAAGLAADTTVSFDVELPAGGTGGVLYFTYSAAGPAGSTVQVDAGPDTAHLSIVLGATSIATTTPTQSFRVIAFSANVARVTYTSGGASAVTFDLSYAFGAGSSTSVDVLSTPATFDTADADGKSDLQVGQVTNARVHIWNGTAWDRHRGSLGVFRTGFTFVGVDDLPNGDLFRPLDQNLSTALPIFGNYIFDGTNWDRQRGSVPTGLDVSSPLAGVSQRSGNAYLASNTENNPGAVEELLVVTADGANTAFFTKVVITNATVNDENFSINLATSNGATCTAENEVSLNQASAGTPTSVAVSVCTTSPTQAGSMIVTVPANSTETFDVVGIIGGPSSEDGIEVTTDTAATGNITVTIWWYEQ